MKAKIIDYKAENIPYIAELLIKGEVGIFPCDTIYGICACVNDANADRIYEIKQRPQAKSFIELMVKEDIVNRGLKVDEELIKRWPAPFTAIVFNSEGTTTAVRVPSDEFLQKLLKMTGPIYSTSVNYSGQMSLLTFDDILPVFEESVDFIVRAPKLAPGQSSTLINATEKPYKVIRQGAYIFN